MTESRDQIDDDVAAAVRDLITTADVLESKLGHLDAQIDAHMHKADMGLKRLRSARIAMVENIETMRRRAEAIEVAREMRLAPWTITTTGEQQHGEEIGFATTTESGGSVRGDDRIETGDGENTEAENTEGENTEAGPT